MFTPQLISIFELFRWSAEILKTQYYFLSLNYRTQKWTKSLVLQTILKPLSKDLTFHLTSTHPPNICHNKCWPFVGPNVGQFCVFEQVKWSLLVTHENWQIKLLVSKTFKGFILHNRKLLLCDPVRQTRQKPNTVKTI